VEKGSGVMATDRERFIQALADSLNAVTATPRQIEIYKATLRHAIAYAVANVPTVESPPLVPLPPDMFTTLVEANAARQKEWDVGNQLTLAYRGNEMAGEVGEACNVIKKIERERLGIKGSRDTVEHLMDELADVVICAGLCAMDVGGNLDAAVARKFNATSEKVGLRTRMVVPE
jgi:NTP pyrophosphatase (non-canonical NTP hydrolase)